MSSHWGQQNSRVETRNETFFFPPVDPLKRKEKEKNPFIMGREQWEKFRMEYKVKAVESIGLKTLQSS